MPTTMIEAGTRVRQAFRLPAVALLGLGLAAAAALPARAQEEPRVIELTQVACQFLESEGGVDRGFETEKKADCEAINAETGDERLAESKTLELKPGTYIFRVTNVDVPYDLGFWLREKGYDWRNPVHKLTKTSVSGGGLAPGSTKDYEVTLEQGDYVYSCPLNPTPDYRLKVVEG
jgi:hypothetical protein